MSDDTGNKVATPPPDPKATDAALQPAPAAEKPAEDDDPMAALQRAVAEDARKKKK
jgi:hypothetical protein